MSNGVSIRLTQFNPSLTREEALLESLALEAIPTEDELIELVTESPPRKIVARRIASKSGVKSPPLSVEESLSQGAKKTNSISMPSGETRITSPPLIPPSIWNLAMQIKP